MYIFLCNTVIFFINVVSVIMNKCIKVLSNSSASVLMLSNLFVILPINEV